MPAKLTLIQPDADTLPEGSRKTPKKSTLIVLISFILDVYSYCFYNDSFASKKYLSQESILMNIASASHGVSEVDASFTMKKNSFNGAPCAYFDGMYEYFNAHAQEFHAEAGMKWNGPCVHL